MKMFFHTDDSLSSFVLRVTVGAVMFPHGAQKLVGWFGGYGFSGTMGAFTEKMGMPWIIAFLVIIGESLGALALVAGFMTRFVAASLAAITSPPARSGPYGHFDNHARLAVTPARYS